MNYLQRKRSDICKEKVFILFTFTYVNVNCVSCICDIIIHLWLSFFLQKTYLEGLNLIVREDNSLETGGVFF